MADLRLSDIAEATQLLTRLPVSGPRRDPRGGKAAWAYPLPGLLVGAIAALIAAVSVAIGLGAPISAALVIASMVLATGALHEDGLADTADGLWGGHSRDRRLEIMKDSRIGAYGVLALILSVLLRWTAITDLLESGHATGALVTAAVLSRAAMPPAVSLVPFARQDGLAVSVGSVSAGSAVIAILIGVVSALVFVDLPALPAILVAAVTAFAILRIAKSKVGGITGDILGAAQQTSEIAVLCCLAALL